MHKERARDQLFPPRRVPRDLLPSMRPTPGVPATSIPCGPSWIDPLEGQSPVIQPPPKATLELHCTGDRVSTQEPLSVSQIQAEMFGEGSREPSLNLESTEPRELLGSSGLGLKGCYPCMSLQALPALTAGPGHRRKLFVLCAGGPGGRVPRTRPWQEAVSAQAAPDRLSSARRGLALRSGVWIWGILAIYVGVLSRRVRIFQRPASCQPWAPRAWPEAGLGAGLCAASTPVGRVGRAEEATEDGRGAVQLLGVTCWLLLRTGSWPGTGLPWDGDPGAFAPSDRPPQPPLTEGKQRAKLQCQVAAVGSSPGRPGGVQLSAPAGQRLQDPSSSHDWALGLPTYGQASGGLESRCSLE